MISKGIRNLHQIHHKWIINYYNYKLLSPTPIGLLVWARKVLDFEPFYTWLKLRGKGIPPFWPAGKNSHESWVMSHDFMDEERNASVPFTTPEEWLPVSLSWSPNFWSQKQQTEGSAGPASDASSAMGRISQTYPKCSTSHKGNDANWQCVTSFWSQT